MQSAEARTLLTNKGYAAGQVDMAIKRAESTAASIAGRIRPEIRELALQDLLDYELQQCEHWLRGVAAAAAR